MILNPTFDVDVACALMFNPTTVVVENPVLETVSFPFTSNRPAGLAIPIPTKPLLSTMKFVPVDEPIANEVTAGAELIERVANGVLVPTPTFPFINDAA